jgi:hypothetical protein
MKNKHILVLLLVLPVSEMKAGFSEWLADHYAVATLATACAARAVWAEYTRHTMIKEFEGSFDRWPFACSKSPGIPQYLSYPYIQEMGMGTEKMIGLFDARGDRSARRAAGALSVTLPHKLVTIKPSLVKLFFYGRPPFNINEHINQAWRQTLQEVKEEGVLNADQVPFVCVFKHKQDAYAVSNRKATIFRTSGQSDKGERVTYEGDEGIVINRWPIIKSGARVTLASQDIWDSLTDTQVEATRENYMNPDDLINAAMLSKLDKILQLESQGILGLELSSDQVVIMQSFGGQNGNY